MARHTAKQHLSGLIILGWLIKAHASRLPPQSLLIRSVIIIILQQGLQEFNSVLVTVHF